jgi:uncharacterized protein (UPF0548 family)
MISFVKPSGEALSRFLADRIDEGFSYQGSDVAEPSPVGFKVDEESTVLGRGPAVFARARIGLQAWQHFALPWVTVYPAVPPIARGTTVVVVARYLGLWWLNACRVVRVISDEPDRWGFSYGTLWAHAESGEESFIVQIQPPDGVVTYRLRAVSRPRALVARIGYPFARALQARFRVDSAAALRRAVDRGTA